MAWTRIELYATAVQDPMSSEVEMSEQFSKQLNEFISQVDLSSSANNKWQPLETWMAQQLGELAESEVVVAYGKSKNMHNRLTQRADQAVFRVALADDEATERTVLERFDEIYEGKKKAHAAAIALVSKRGDGPWEARAIGVFRRPVPSYVDRFVTLTGIAPPKEIDDEEQLARSLFLPVDWIRDVLWLLEDKKGVVFYGPPGTGKTYIAQRIAEFLQHNPKYRTTVQLHPSFGYEEFFEGYRPSASDVGSGLALEKKNGPFKELVERTPDDEAAVLLLDEMNRGNLPRVFGELYFLLEYRDSAVELMYSPGQPFTLPEQLMILGTMNTADRSVALLDQALRRRFHFVGLFPGEEPVASMLRGYLAEHYPKGRMTWLADVLDKANAMLDRNVAIGPSHFMRRDLDNATIRRIWRHSVLPTIEEHYFGQQDRLEAFELENLMSEAGDDVEPYPS